jgi:hypothetical protein
VLLTPLPSFPATKHLQDIPKDRLHHTVITCDPEIVGEMLARQEDFPKLWGRQKAEKALQGFAGEQEGWAGRAWWASSGLDGGLQLYMLHMPSTVEGDLCRIKHITHDDHLLSCLSAGNGLFTSSTQDHDWQVAHGLLPRGFNQIRIKNYFGVSATFSVTVEQGH